MVFFFGIMIKKVVFFEDSAMAINFDSESYLIKYVIICFILQNVR